MTAIMVADTSVLVNFPSIDRMGLLGGHPSRFLATDPADSEIEDDERRVRYNAAVSVGYIETCVVNDSDTNTHACASAESGGISAAGSY